MRVVFRKKKGKKGRESLTWITDPWEKLRLKRVNGWLFSFAFLFIETPRVVKKFSDNYFEMWTRWKQLWCYMNVKHTWISCRNEHKRKRIWIRWCTINSLYQVIIIFLFTFYRWYVFWSFISKRRAKVR